MTLSIAHLWILSWDYLLWPSSRGLGWANRPSVHSLLLITFGGKELPSSSRVFSDTQVTTLSPGLRYSSHDHILTNRSRREGRICTLVDPFVTNQLPCLSPQTLFLLPVDHLWGFKHLGASSTFTKVLFCVTLATAAFFKMIPSTFCLLRIPHSFWSTIERYFLFSGSNIDYIKYDFWNISGFGMGDGNEYGSSNFPSYLSLEIGCHVNFWVSLLNIFAVFTLLLVALLIDQVAFTEEFNKEDLSLFFLISLSDFLLHRTAKL